MFSIMNNCIHNTRFNIVAPVLWSSRWWIYNFYHITHIRKQNYCFEILKINVKRKIDINKLRVVGLEVIYFTISNTEAWINFSENIEFENGLSHDWAYHTFFMTQLIKIVLDLYMNLYFVHLNKVQVLYY